VDEFCAPGDVTESDWRNSVARGGGANVVRTGAPISTAESQEEPHPGLSSNPVGPTILLASLFYDSFLESYSVQSQGWVFAIHSATRHNLFRSNNLTSSNPVACLSKAKVLITNGPYLETKEHIGGFWMLEATDMNEALEWGRKAVIACRGPVEVRQFHSL
jgi:hypothetical protein